MTATRALAERLVGGQDTILALATPPGRGAISIIRMSGSNAVDIASLAAEPWPLEPRRATLCRISDPRGGDLLDHALVTVFIAPESFTGENLVEISGHGGNYVPNLVMAALISLGARQALPGEFTRRAVLNGKLDITQAEAIGDIVDARSEAMHRTALGQLDGGLSRRVRALREDLILVESLIAYDIDFPEEDDGPISRERIGTEVMSLLVSLDGLLATIPIGEIIREGAVVVIAGHPNVGKSSLFNALLGQARAIVTEIPGTTRDAIEGFVETGSWPLRLVDTAGLRATLDTVERIGIEVSERYLSRADVVIACGDTTESLSATMIALNGKTEAPVIVVRTKSDLIPRDADKESVSLIRASAETGEGLGDLLNEIDRTLFSITGSMEVDAPILTRSRQIHAIRQAREEISAFKTAWCYKTLPAPVAAVHLRSAVGALETLIGAVSTEDVLDRVFSSFCVGK